MNPTHRAARRVNLELEMLSDRVVPSCTWVEEDGVLVIRGDASANVVEIVDDGTTLTITCDGENVELSGDPVTDLVVSLGNGNDQVTYTLQGDIAADETRSLLVCLGNGHDFFSGVLEDGEDPDTGDVVASSLADNAALTLIVRGMNGHDRLGFDASATDVGAGAELVVALVGGNGKDTLAATFGGALLGDLTLWLSGGNGKDSLFADATFDSTFDSTTGSAETGGTAQIKLLGCNGKDSLTLYTTDNSGDDGDDSTEDTSTLTELVATASGGRGPDFAYVTDDVEVLSANERPPRKK